MTKRKLWLAKLQWQRWLKLLVVLLLLDLLATVSYFGYLWQSFESVSFREKEAEAAAVFFHGFTSKGNIDQETWQRLFSAAQLVLQNKVKQIVCLGGNRKNRPLSGSFLMKQRLLQKWGLSSHQVICENHSYDSLSNGQQLHKIATKQGWQTLVLVSSPPHLYRLASLLPPLFQASTKIFIHPHRYETFSSLGKLAAIWQDVHHEWLAYTVYYALPQRVYQKGVYWWRNLE